jgi:hypothetical protein
VNLSKKVLLVFFVGLGIYEKVIFIKTTKSPTFPKFTNLRKIQKVLLPVNLKTTLIRRLNHANNAEIPAWFRHGSGVIRALLTPDCGDNSQNSVVIFPIIFKF